MVYGKAMISSITCTMFSDVLCCLLGQAAFEKRDFNLKEFFFSTWLNKGLIDCNYFFKHSV